jgi:hypothetical protein
LSDKDAWICSLSFHERTSARILGQFELQEESSIHWGNLDLGVSVGSNGKQSRWNRRITDAGEFILKPLRIWAWRRGMTSAGTTPTQGPLWRCLINRAHWSKPSSPQVTSWFCRIVTAVESYCLSTATGKAGLKVLLTL